MALKYRTASASIPARRPLSTSIWTGDPADPWPLGAWLVGAAIAIAAAGPTASPEKAISLSPRWRR